MQGTVKWFNKRKGYGFITDTEGKDHFLHQTSIQMDGYQFLDKDDIAEFEIGKGTNEREQAINVQPIITRRIVAHELSKEKLHLRRSADDKGWYIADETGHFVACCKEFSLIEVAAYAGIDTEGLEEK